MLNCNRFFFLSNKLNGIKIVQRNHCLTTGWIETHEVVKLKETRTHPYFQEGFKFHQIATLPQVTVYTKPYLISVLLYFHNGVNENYIFNTTVLMVTVVSFIKKY